MTAKKTPKAKIAGKSVPAVIADELATIAAPSATTAELCIWQIEPDPLNPRKDFESEGAVEALQELKASIVRDGLLENLVVRPIEGKTVFGTEDPDEERSAYMLIAGERRWRALRLAAEEGLWPLDRAVTCSIRAVDEATARRLALVENLQRRDLNYMEEARSLQQLCEIEDKPASQVGEELGFTPRWAQQRIQLLQLTEPLQARLERKELKLEEAREILGMWERLPPIKRAELERGSQTVAQVKEWLKAQPVPLSDAAKLAIMEFLEKSTAQPFKPNEWTSRASAKIVARTERVDRGANGVTVNVKVDDEAFDELRKVGIFDAPGHVRIEEVETGEHFVTLTYFAEAELKTRFASALNPRFRATAIPTLRVQLHGLQVDHSCGQEGTFATAWLNAPTAELPADVAAEIARKRQARLDNEAEWQRRREAEAKARTEAQAADQARVAKLKAVRGDLLQAAKVGPGALSGLTLAAAQDAGLQLPLIVTDDGAILDAVGGVVMQADYWSRQGAQLATRILFVAAVNAAAGLETPDKPPVAAEDQEAREDFLKIAADALSEDHEDLQERDYGDAMPIATRWAEKGLAALLAERGCEYGAEGHAWDHDAALDLAERIRTEAFGQDDKPAEGEQIDIEAAIEAADDIELSPAVLALAKGTARPIAGDEALTEDAA